MELGTPPIIGPHGAGLSHLLFAAPGTRVVEFLFMRDPPMMFWHMARALDMDYWMLPVPQAYWMEPEMEIPVAEVLDILSAALGGKANRACPEGREVAPAADGGSACVECRPDRVEPLTPARKVVLPYKSPPKPVAVLVERAARPVAPQRDEQARVVLVLYKQASKERRKPQHPKMGSAE